MEWESFDQVAVWQWLPTGFGLREKCEMSLAAARGGGSERQYMRVTTQSRVATHSTTGPKSMNGPHNSVTRRYLYHCRRWVDSQSQRQILRLS